MKTELFDLVEARAEAAALVLEDRLNRYISSPQEHDLAMPTVWPFIYRSLLRKFPWEESTAPREEPTS